MLAQSAVLYFAFMLRQLFHKEYIGSQHANICPKHPVALMLHFKYEEVEGHIHNFLYLSLGFFYWI